MNNAVSILVTGTSSGIGRITAETLAREGHTVFATMRGVDGKNSAVAAEFRQLATDNDWDLHVVELDVTDDQSVQKAILVAMQIAGRIDVLMMNAGVATFGMVESFTLEQTRQLFDVNVFGALRLNREVLPDMRRRGSGYLIYVSSDSGRVLFPAIGTYSGSKWALEAIAESAHYELTPLGIDTTIVQPGNYRTEIGANIMFAADQERSEKYGPAAQVAQRYLASLRTQEAGDPQDIANAIVKLIETPAGQRPLRLPMGSPMQQQLEAINQVAAEAQARLMPELGIDT